MSGDPVWPTAVDTLPGIAISKIMNSTNPPIAETSSDCIIVRGAVRRGSFVSSARSAQPSQPIRVKIGSSAARPRLVALNDPPPAA